MTDTSIVPLKRRTFVAALSLFTGLPGWTNAAAAHVTVTLKMISCDRNSGTGGVHLLVFRDFFIKNRDDIRLRNNAPERKNIDLPDFKRDHREVPFDLVLISELAIGSKTVVVEMWDKGAVRPLQDNAPYLLGQIYFDLKAGRVAHRPGVGATGPYHNDFHPSWPSYRFTGWGSSYKFDFDVQQGRN
jgi:hypothetical protein